MQYLTKIMPRIQVYQYPWKTEQKPKCVECKTKPELSQINWALIHEDGYMDDIPWHWLAHSHASPKNITCRDYNNLSLKHDKEPNKWILKCNACNTTPFKFSESTLKSKTLFEKIVMNQQPWIFQKANILEKAPIAVEINNARIYQPVTDVGLVIPPESRIKTDSLTAKLYSLRGEIEKLYKYQKRKPLFESQIRVLAGVFNTSPDEIRNAWDEIQKGFPYFEKSNSIHGDPRELEYQALITPIADLQENEAFVPEHRSHDWKRLHPEKQQSAINPIIRSIDRLVAIHRLKALWVYKGFRRAKGNPVPPDIEDKQDWYPAMELFGEGVFVTISEPELAEWEKLECVRKRVSVALLRLQTAKSDNLPTSVSPRFILLHTLSHLMIRQMEFSCGYPAASLKERLYIQSPTEGQMPMSGILIWVAVPDKVGSLGGLVSRQLSSVG